MSWAKEFVRANQTRLPNFDPNNPDFLVKAEFLNLLKSYVDANGGEINLVNIPLGGYPGGGSWC
jgi:ApbE superfamily uncharacterized protein (UPF0280 family)